MVIWEATRVVVEVVGNTRSHLGVSFCTPAAHTTPDIPWPTLQIKRAGGGSGSAGSITGGLPERALWARACWILGLHTLPSKGRVYPSFFLPLTGHRAFCRGPTLSSPKRPIRDELKNVPFFHSFFFFFFFISCVFFVRVRFRAQIA